MAQKSTNSTQPKKKRPARIYILFGVLLVVIGYAVFSIIWGSSWHVPPEAASWKNPVPEPANLGKARQIYSDKCAHCHGKSGKGDGADARNYDPQPTDFTSASVANEPDGVLFFKLSQGKRPMPSFRRKLTEYQRWELVRLIRSFAVGDSLSTP
jgi:mono/diheme cytochrome c family protein